MGSTGQIDAQMSMFKVWRPYDGFESRYQGQAGTIPIAFPGTLAPEAGRQGYDAGLLTGIPVPLGARLTIWFPMTVEMYTPQANYEYQLIWRVRNASDVGAAIEAGRQPSAFHLRSQEPGRNEIGNVGPRIFIPGASDVEIFEQDQEDNRGQLNIVQQRYLPQITAPWVQPLLKDGGEGVWQQGVYQFSSNVNCAGPTWAPVWTDAAGDELLILAYKIDSDEVWDFSGPDLAFSNTYGTNNGGLPNNPNVGIIVSTGNMAP